MKMFDIDMRTKIPLHMLIFMQKMFFYHVDIVQEAACQPFEHFVRSV